MPGVWTASRSRFALWCILGYLVPHIGALNWSTDPEFKALLQKWVEEFTPSVLTPTQQLDELQWFHDTAQAFNLTGVSIRTCAEDLATHHYESDTVAPAFSQITGINVNHEIVDEGNLVPTLMEQVRTGKSYFDAFVNDADLIGTHMRTQRIHWIHKNGTMNPLLANVTNPQLDLADWMNPEMGTDIEGVTYQLLDQQFANLYWYRYDWFTDPAIKKAFKDLNGYALGVPKSFKSYEAIADFFTNNCRFPPNAGPESMPVCYDGTVVPKPADWNSRRQIYGHLDYGALNTLSTGAPSLSWRYTDAWFSMSGIDDQGLPNGGGFAVPYPQDGVDEWGIKVVNAHPVGASVARGGAIDSYAAVYGLNKSIDWLLKYSPRDSLYWDFVTSGPKTSRGDIAQQAFMYVTWLSDVRYKLTTSSFVVDNNGRPKWRVAPSPHGRYWDEGQKVGYQDPGSWTFPKTTNGKQLLAAWLWAQFAVSKTVELKKFTVGGTPVRKSTINAQFLTDRLEFYGGLVEFYRSAEEKKWTCTGTNVPHYSALAAVWAPNIAKAINSALNTNSSDVTTPAMAMQRIAQQMDELMSRMRFTKYSPQMATPQDESVVYAHASGCRSPYTNATLNVKYCSPKPLRGVDQDYDYTVELKASENYQNFMTRYSACAIDPSTGSMAASCAAS
ncbi:hypothetical protein HK104_006378 [Borealophlyctis nickersoniae]|nr:hypothetical protein HK104_006378 [Borealophlyctis nickersoniae]